MSQTLSAMQTMNCTPPTAAPVVILINPAVEAPCAPAGASWILALDEPSFANIAPASAGRILWVSPVAPREIVGHLADEFEGAWIDGSATAVFRCNGVEKSAPTPGSKAVADLREWLARELAAWISGCSEPAPSATPGSSPESVLALAA